MMGRARGRIGPRDCMFARIWVTLMFMVGRAIPESIEVLCRPENTRGCSAVSVVAVAANHRRGLSIMGQNNVLDKARLAQPCTAVLYSALLHLGPCAKNGNLSLTGLTSTARIEYLPQTQSNRV